MKLEVIRVIDDDGNVVAPEREPRLSGDEHRRLMHALIRIRMIDERMLRLQRQGRLGFYVSTTGEEATHIGAAAALRVTDWFYSAYREVGAALYRGYALRTFMCQLFGNAEDPVKGRQMPVHHTARHLNFVTVASPVATQIPHAVGTAWAAKLQKKDDVAVAFFGDGGTSTPIFHTSCLFAGLYKVPAIIVCRNNGWAISVPRSVQTITPTFAQKAVAYGLPGILVDGNDPLAMVHVIGEAAARGRRGDGATLVEARTYRRGAHSSSDDPSVYRDPAEPREWEARDPIDRYRKYLERKGELTPEVERGWREAITAEITDALRYAESVAPKPPLRTMFEDVYAQVPWHLEEQYEELRAHLARHGEAPPDAAGNPPAQSRSPAGG